jgi:hypothetical protein
MKTEEEEIQLLLEWFNMSPFTSLNDAGKFKGEEIKKIIYKMQGLDFIQIQTIGHFGGGAFVSLTPKGRSILINGGYKQFLILEEHRRKEEGEKREREKKAYEYTKKTFIWVIIGTIAAILTIIISLFSYFKK